MTNTEIYNPVHYVMNERKDLRLKTESDNFVVYEPGWYFWDETWDYRHGPFETKEEANNNAFYRISI